MKTHYQILSLALVLAVPGLFTAACDSEVVPLAALDRGLAGDVGPDVDMGPADDADGGMRPDPVDAGPPEPFVPAPRGRYRSPTTPASSGSTASKSASTCEPSRTCDPEPTRIKR